MWGKKQTKWKALEHCKHFLQLKMVANIKNNVSTGRSVFETNANQLQGRFPLPVKFFSFSVCYIFI